MDYVLLAKMVAKMASIAGNDTDDLDDCYNWGPCELCEWGVEKFDNLMNRTIEKGGFDWRELWDGAMDKLDGEYFGRKWLIKSVEDNTNYKFTQDSMNNFFSNFKCNSSGGISTGPSNTYYFKFSGGRYSDIQFNNLGRYYVHTGNLGGSNNPKIHTNYYPNDLFIQILEMLKTMMCTNTTFPVLVDLTKSLGSLSTYVTQASDSDFNPNGEDKAFTPIMTSTTYNSDVLFKPVVSESSAPIPYSIQLDQNGFKGVPIAIPSLTQMTRASLEGVMIYRWVDARNHKDRPSTYRNWCTKNKFCSSNQTSHYKLNEPISCPAKGMVNYAVKKIIEYII